jgi:integrase
LILDALNGTQVSIDKKGGKLNNVELKPNLQMTAMTLLGINCGLGNTDVSGLQFSHLDLDSGWLDFPREKTGLPRRCPLWPQTITALDTVIAKRRKPKHAEDSDCVFINRAGRRMVQSTEAYHQDYISSQFRALLRELTINGRRGLGFYSLRHTFATIGLQSRDRDAVKAIMGHASHDMLSIYDETGPDDSRLLAVTNHVHKWLFA